MVFEHGKNELEIRKKAANWSQGVDGGIFWGGLAECASRAEALEFVKSLHLISHACAPQRGRRIQSAARAFRWAFLSRGRWELPPNREPWK